MEKFINSGIVFYLIIALYLIAVLICILRRYIFSTIARDAVHMGDTKNHFLKHIRLKYENIFRLDKGVYNTKAFVEKYLMQKKCCGISVYKMKYIQETLRLLIVYMGVYVSVYTYFSGGSLRDTNIFLYGVGSVFMWLTLEIMDNLFAVEYVREKAIITISDYLDNYLRNQLRPKQIKNTEKIQNESTKINKVADKNKTKIEMGNDNDIKEDINILKEREWSDNKIIEEVLREFFAE